MVFDVGVFRRTFAEFSNTVTYPEAMITFWSDFAQAQVRECVWGKVWLQGVSFYTAHELVLAAQNAKLAQNGGIAGTSGGIANAKTVGQASVSYDTTSTAERDGGYWNLTNYGKQFLRLARMYGARPVQL